jgi:LmbE family N-acetylglucosaminyl deacetylase
VLVLHAAPHPDDELIGAPATLMALRDAGHSIVNLACSYGRKEDAQRRRAEVEEACRRAHFELVELEQPMTDEPHGDAATRDAAERRLSVELERLLSARPFELVVGPSPHDRHPGHELVARALRDTLEAGAGPDRWWMWGLWGELPFPTTVVQFSRRRLHEICSALAAHKQELKRNDYRRLVTARSRASTVLAAELAFGFGKPGLPGPYAEATTEVVRRADSWRLGAARELDPEAPFPPPAGPGMGWWLEARSAADGLRAAGQSGR